MLNKNDAPSKFTRTFLVFWGIKLMELCNYTWEDRCSCGGAATGGAVEPELGHSRDRSKTSLLQLWINKSLNLTRNGRRNEVRSDLLSSVTLVALATR